MNHPEPHTNLTKVAIPQAKSGNVDAEGANLVRQYSAYLAIRSVCYNLNRPYLQVGNAHLNQVWTLNISVVTTQMDELIDKVLDYLIGTKCSFAIAENSNIHNLLLSGGLGYDLIGKVLTVYPENDTSAEQIARFLITATSTLQGPDVPGSIPIGSCIYASKLPLLSGKKLGFSVSHKASWPFGNIKAFETVKNKKWIGKRYIKLFPLKIDAKGSVYKGINLTKWTDIQWCVIKQGKRFQCMDNSGRDMTDRLRWQFEVQSCIAGKVSVPKPVELIRISGDAYFIMEFIEGEAFNNRISAIQKGRIWHSIDSEGQLYLIQLLLRLTTVIEDLHNLGYVHRDLSPVNFLVTTGNEIVAIDIELCYHIGRNEPDPFFTIGTEGYMSPEQRAGKTPTFWDDVFGLGSLLLNTLTGVSAKKFDLVAGQTLFKHIDYFVKNKRLSDVINSCFGGMNFRPSIQSIRDNLEFYHTLILTKNYIETPSAFYPNAEILQPIIVKGINSFSCYPMLRSEQMWYSKTTLQNNQLGNALRSYSWYPDFYRGSCGIIYMLCQSVAAGYDSNGISGLLLANYERVKSHFANILTVSGSGLYNGTSGLSITAANMIKAGLISNTTENIDMIKSFCMGPVQGLKLSDGISGQGLAMLKCGSMLNIKELLNYSSDIASILIKEQGRNGSWKIISGTSCIETKSIGFLEGTAGIIYFLMIYGSILNNKTAQDSSLKALNWLLQKRMKTDGNHNWPISLTNRTFNPWFAEGFSGIAFLFIKAYELYKCKAFKAAAIESLLFHPKEITSNYLGQADGLCGLGEVYLEAYRVFNEVEWFERAGKIIEFFTHTYKEGDNGNIFWLDGNNDLPEPDFMSGQAGIIHFLLRFQNPSKINFPLIAF